MDNLILIASVALLLLAIKSHTLTQANTIKTIERPWYDRLFTGSRPARDNLTEEGLKHRRQSNLYAIAGFIALGVYVYLREAA